MDLEAALDFGDDAVAEGGYFGEGSFAAVDEGEGVAAGDSCAAHGETFVEAGLIEEPGGGEFDLAVGCGPVRDGVRVAIQGGGDTVERGGRHDGIFEEGADALSVGTSLPCQHSFLSADGADGVVDLAEGGLLAGGDLLGEVGLDVGVAEGGFCRRDAGCR